MKYNVINTAIYIISTIVFFIYLLVDGDGILGVFGESGLGLKEPALAYIIFAILIMFQTFYIAWDVYLSTGSWWKIGFIWIPGVSCVVNGISWFLIFGITMVLYLLLGLALTVVSFGLIQIE